MSEDVERSHDLSDKIMKLLEEEINDKPYIGIHALNKVLATLIAVFASSKDGLDEGLALSAKHISEVALEIFEGEQYAKRPSRVT